MKNNSQRPLKRKHPTRRYTAGLLVIAIYILCTMGCDNSVMLEDITPETKTIVVDGWIETGEVPHVTLTYTIPYFSYVDSNIFNFVDARAKVTVSDGNLNEILVLRSDKTKFPYFSYSGDKIKGVPGNTYRLTVEHLSKTITAETTIPEIPVIDSCWFEIVNLADSLAILWLQFDDPDYAETNYYRVLTQSGEQKSFVPSLFPNYSDETIGSHTTKLPIYQRLDNQFINSPVIYFDPFLDYSIKVQTMSKEIFDIWGSYQNESYNAANPYAESKINVKTNIDGDGYGIWAGYGVSVYQLEKYKKSLP